MNHKRRILEAAAGLLLIALPALAQPYGPAVGNSPTDREERILSFIHQADLHDIAAAKLVKQKSSSQQVKDFADRVIGEADAAEQQVRAYAQKHGVDLDALRQHVIQVNNDRLEEERRSKALGSATGEYSFTWENANMAKHQYAKASARLQGLTGAAFDREFASDMVQFHQREVDRLVRLRDHGIDLIDDRDYAMDPDLRNLIDNLLPTVKQHLQAAQALQGAVSKA